MNATVFDHAERPAWHRLLAPLPPAAKPDRQPVASPEALASAPDSPIAGWQRLLIELSAGSAGLRIVLVVVDEAGTPLIASDHVLYLSTQEPRATLQESIGGRFEPDGTFRGTCWRTEGPEPSRDEEPTWQSTPREPTEPEVTALRALVADVLDRHRSPDAG